MQLLKSAITSLIKGKKSLGRAEMTLGDPSVFLSSAACGLAHLHESSPAISSAGLFQKHACCLLAVLIRDG